MVKMLFGKCIYIWGANAHDRCEGRLFKNKDKSLALGFHHKLNKHVVFPDIIFKDRQITYVSETKFVGVWLDHNLNWDFHVGKLVIKLSKLCFAIKTICK
jgi:hypothetical protein